MKAQRPKDWDPLIRFFERAMRSDLRLWHEVTQAAIRSEQILRAAMRKIEARRA